MRKETAMVLMTRIKTEENRQILMQKINESRHMTPAEIGDALRVIKSMKID